MSKVSDPFYKGYVIEFNSVEKILVPTITIPVIQTYKQHVVAEEDTLLSIANEEYDGDTTKWYIIAEANSLENLIELSIGSILLIPQW